MTKYNSTSGPRGKLKIRGLFPLGFSESPQDDRRDLCSRTMKVDTALLPIKVHYFLLLASQAGFYAFLPLVAAEMGFTPASFAVVYTTMPFFDLVAGPLLGAFGDRFKCWKGLTRCFLSLIAIMGFFLYAIPWITPHITSPDFHAHIECGSNSSSLIAHPDLFNSSCIPTVPWSKCSVQCGRSHLTSFLSLPSLELRNLSDESLCLEGMPCEFRCDRHVYQCLNATEKPEDGSIYATFRFWAVYVSVMANWVPIVVVFLLTNATCYELLPPGSTYGKQKLWGALGQGLAALLCGYLVGGMKDSQPDYLVVYIVQAACLVIDMILLSFIPLSQPPPSPHFFRTLRNVLRKPHLVIYIIGGVLAGACQGLQWTYQFWFLESLGSPPFMVGLVTAFAMLGEIPFLYFSQAILKKLGYYLCMSLSLAAYGARFAVYVWMKAPWIMVPVEVAQGPAWGLLRASMATYAKEAAPPGLEATMQGVVNSGFELGVAVGILTSGVTYEMLGPRSTWGGFTVFAFVGAVMYVLFHCCGPRHLRPHNAEEIERKMAPPLLTPNEKLPIA